MTVKTSKRKDATWVFKTLLFMSMGSVLVGGALLGGLFWHFSSKLPQIVTVADYRPLVVTRIYGAAESAEALPVMGEFYKERRFVIPYEKIPEVVVRAFISAEDDRFFEHMGVNITSMLRAAIANLRAGHVVQGGSTITQQVAKSMLPEGERGRNFGRKIKELILSNRMEHNLTKQQILFLYLNQIYLGHGAYGVEAAAKTYFRKQASELSVAEAAVLAGLPQAPGKYSPIINPKKAKERQLYVLRRMFENHYISQAQFTEAKAQSLRLYHDEDVNKKFAPYLIEQVRRYLVEKYGEDAVYENGLNVYLPTRPSLARSAGVAVREGLLQIDKRIGYRGPVRHLKTAEEMSQFVSEARTALIDRRIHFQMFTPEGKLDAFEAIKSMGIKSETELLEAGELYEAVVTAVDDQRKVTRVAIGAVSAELPLDRMKWAHPVKDDKAPVPARGEPTLPSRVFQVGDVILVKWVDDPKLANASHDGVVVQLEQEPQVQAALVSVEARTGAILAMEGGFDFEASEFNRAIQALRQPGSSFKPLVYAAAIEKGYTAASIIVDSPIVYNDGDNGKWKPSNFEEKFYGDTTFRQALIKSRNIPTIKIAQAVTVPGILDFTKRIGIEGRLPADLSICLGSAGVSLFEMTKAYAVFPRLGRKVSPVFISKVVDRDGKPLEESKLSALPATPVFSAVFDEKPKTAAPDRVELPKYPPPNDLDQVMDPRVAYVMTHLMKEVINYGTGHEAKALNRPAAGKTGTTSDSIDAWFMGFTPHVVTGVWVGFDGQKSIGHNETGAKAALPIWLSYMKNAVKIYPDEDFTIPSGVVFASIDSNTGKPLSPNSSQAIKEAFIEGTQPSLAPRSGGKVSAPAAIDFFKEDNE